MPYSPRRGDLAVVWRGGITGDYKVAPTELTMYLQYIQLYGRYINY
jgi:hypothetical protein